MLCSVLLFNSSLFSSIAEEIDFDEAQFENALKFSKLSDVVENLANGVNTNIGENGVMLSGGQRQRIALARAFYFQKKVFLEIS